MQKQTVAMVPSYVEHNINMVVCHGQCFHLIFLGHIHHFGPDPCGWRELSEVDTKTLRTTCSAEKLTKLKKKRKGCFLSCWQKDIYTTGVQQVQVLDKMALKWKLQNNLNVVCEVMETWGDSILWWINYKRLMYWGGYSTFIHFSYIITCHLLQKPN